MLLSEPPTSSNCASTSAAALAVMLEKEQHSYQRCPPNPHVPLAEYTQDRPLLVNWCRKFVGRGNFRSPGELVQTAMALADKFMSHQHLQTYMKDHYQLIVVTCLNIAMKTDSPAKAPTYEELSEICQGAYTPEEIASEEMCILQVLSWYVHPPTASQAANHILAIVKDSAGADGQDWELLADRVHRLIDGCVLDLGLSMLRPSTVAMAAILVSAKALDGQDTRQRVTGLGGRRSHGRAGRGGSQPAGGLHQTETFRVITPPQAPEGSSVVTPTTAQTASPPVQSACHEVHGRRDAEDPAEANRLPRRTRPVDPNRVNDSIECRDSDDMKVAGSSSGGSGHFCMTRIVVDPLSTSRGDCRRMERKYLVPNVPNLSCEGKRGALDAQGRTNPHVNWLAARRVFFDQKIAVPDRHGKWLYREPSAWGSPQGPPSGPGRPAMRVFIENSALASVRECPLSAKTDLDRVVRTSRRGRQICTKSSFLESSRRALQVDLNRRIQIKSLSFDEF
ncbi:hypothetical protein THAOC_33181, partial [Thalassiosira oceanica]